MDDGDIDEDDDIDGDEEEEEERERERIEKTKASIASGVAGKRRGRVFLVRPSDDVVNLILVAVKEGGPPTVTGLGPGRDVC